VWRERCKSDAEEASGIPRTSRIFESSTHPRLKTHRRGGTPAPECSVAPDPRVHPRGGEARVVAPSITGRTSQHRPRRTAPPRQPNNRSSHLAKTVGPLRQDQFVPEMMPSAVGWSERCRSVVAKTDRESDLTLNLPDHLEDAENTARLLWQDFVPDAVRRVISDDLGGTEPALALVCFLAGTHDVGKASSAFAQKLPPTATSRSSSLGLKIHAVRAPAPHGAIGQIAAREWLESAVGKGPGAYDLAEIIGGHHGTYPKREDLRLIKDDLATWEAPGWSPIRAEVLATMAAATGADAYLAGWVATGIPMRTKILVEAIVIMADWIASGSDLFPYADDRASSERAMDALEALSFPPPWNPSATQRVELEELFRDRFPHLACGSPNDLQRVVTELARASTL